jgi:hypothetical protein
VLDLNCSWVCSFPVPVRKSYARIAPSHWTYSCDTEQWLQLIHH